MDRRLFLFTLLAACGPVGAIGTRYQLVVLRHADRDPEDLVLNARGEARAAALPAALDGVPIDAIYLPDLERNRQTAAPLAAARGIEPRAVDTLPGFASRLLTGNEGRSIVWIGNSTNLSQMWQELDAPGGPPTGYGEIVVLRGRGPGSFSATPLRYDP